MRWILILTFLILGCAPRTYIQHTTIVIPMPDTLKVVVIPAPVIVDSARIKALEQERLEKEGEARRAQAAKTIIKWFDEAFGYTVVDYRGDFNTWYELKYFETALGRPEAFKWVRYEYFPGRHAWEPTANWEEIP